MDRIVPWERLCAVVARHYPTGEGGRPAIALERMLRIYFLQQWFNLGDPTVEGLLEEVNAHLAENGLKIGRGTIVDATIIAAPSSTKNASGERDPEMHQTMKGNEWHFGMKAHIGMDSTLRIVHSFAATPATSTIATFCPSCCTETRRAFGATQPVVAKRR
jgi:IS5 family transposase